MSTAAIKITVRREPTNTSLVSPIEAPLRSVPCSLARWISHCRYLVGRGLAIVSASGANEAPPAPGMCRRSSVSMTEAPTKKRGCRRNDPNDPPPRIGLLTYARAWCALLGFVDFDRDFDGDFNGQFDRRSDVCNDVCILLIVG